MERFDQSIHFDIHNLNEFFPKSQANYFAIKNIRQNERGETGRVRNNGFERTTYPK